jgi:hypothetical protein
LRGKCVANDSALQRRVLSPARYERNDPSIETGATTGGSAQQTAQD